MLDNQEFEDDREQKVEVADKAESLPEPAESLAKPAEPSKPAGAPAPAGRRKSLVRGAAALGLLLALGGGVYYGNYWWTAGRFLVSTDDAYVGAKSATLSPKVSGYISDIAVADNAQVSAGDVIARIDDGDYRLAVQTARDQIAVQQATVQRLGQQVTAQEAMVDQAKAQLASTKAGLTRADLELKRQ
ncbi:MAG: biotin/lipoyl-binding protein, partial [Hyphomicrobium sp.]|nr:biotin/lipoyl-binding protein [Hyphomicrobium sp.]